MDADNAGLKVAVEEPRAWARRLTITVPAERVEQEMQEVARRLAKRVRLPGFRQGKVPSKVLERKFGAAIEHEAVERVVGEAYQAALQQEGLNPITQGNVDQVDYQRGSDLTFHVEFEVRPEVELARVGGFTIERPKAEVDEAEVDRVLERLREDQAVWKPLEEQTPVAGDVVKVEITPLDEGATGEPRSYEFALGEGQAVEDVEDAIRTLRPGQEEAFSIDLPDGEGGEEKPNRVRIRLVEAKRPELPALDDEFARSVGDFEEMATLRARIREDLEREAASETERSVRHQLLDRIMEANPFDVPASMVDRYLDQMIQPREGADPGRVAEAKASARPAAEDALKRMLVIERVAAQHGLAATQDEVDARIEEMAARYERPVGELWAQLQKSGRLQALEEEITEQKVFGFLESQSTIV